MLIKVICTPVSLSLSDLCDVKEAHAKGEPLPHGAWYEHADTNHDRAPQPLKPASVPELLESMAQTYRERNAVYGDNWRNVGNVVMQLFPKGVELRDANALNTWHLFELIIVKLTRFANSGLKHSDSIHDIAVYAAMIEAALLEKSNGKIG